jgi:hypothetical protein
MTEPVKVGFERTIAVRRLSTLLPLKTVPDAIRQSAKFKQIAKSVGEVGIIEPLVVARSKDHKRKVPTTRRAHAACRAGDHGRDGSPLPHRR